jgi:hypothetical protein
MTKQKAFTKEFEEEAVRLTAYDRSSRSTERDLQSSFSLQSRTFPLDQAGCGHGQ